MVWKSPILRTYYKTNLLLGFVNLPVLHATKLQDCTITQERFRANINNFNAENVTETWTWAWQTSIFEGQLLVLILTSSP
jgi:hypothetical protein